MEVASELVEIRTQIYRRELPGAGYVAIEVTTTHEESSGREPVDCRIRRNSTARDDS